MPKKSAPFKRKPMVEFSPERREMYIDYVRDHGVFSLAAAYAGVTPETAQVHRKADPDFESLVQAAKEDHTDMLIQEATRRAVVGFDEPIIGGPFKDKIVAKKRIYSDSLLQTLLRSKRAEYGAQGAEAIGGGGGSGGGVLIVPYAPDSIVEWVELYGEAAKGLPPVGAK